MGTQWYFLANQRRRGPVSFEELLEALSLAPSPLTVLVWNPHLPDWTWAEQVEEIRDRLPPQAPGLVPRDGGSELIGYPEATTVAKLFRRLVLLVGVQILISIPSRASSVVLEAAESPSMAAGLLATVCFIILLGVLVGLAITAYQLTERLGSSVSLIWAIAMFLPYANIITLLLISARAQAWCRRYGIGVGLFGPKKESIEALRERDSAAPPPAEAAPH